MSERKRTIQEVYEIYEYEGHGYGLENYMWEANTDDEELNELWKNASDSIKKLTKYFADKVESGELELFDC